MRMAYYKGSLGKLSITLRIDSSDGRRISNSLHANDVGSRSHIDLVLPGRLEDIVISAEQYLLHLPIDLVLLPEELLQVLHPLEIGDDRATCVCQDVRHQIHALVIQNPVGGRSRGAVCSLD